MKRQTLSTIALVSALSVLRFWSVRAEFYDVYDVTCEAGCQGGRCRFMDCEAPTCRGGGCEFQGCRRPSCRGGGCRFVSCSHPTCDGGGCDFVEMQTTLKDGYCRGGKCQLDGNPFPSVVKGRLSV
ncbi:unnamed protein product [Phaeothamnion confervicola]